MYKLSLRWDADIDFLNHPVYTFAVHYCYCALLPSVHCHLDVRVLFWTEVLRARLAVAQRSAQRCSESLRCRLRVVQSLWACLSSSGKFSGEGAGACSNCGPGQFASFEMSSLCTFCPAGEYQDSTAQARCIEVCCELCAFFCMCGSPLLLSSMPVCSSERFLCMLLMPHF